MKKSGKVLVYVLCFTLILGIAGCGKTEQQGQDKPDAGEQRTEKEVWVVGHLPTIRL